MYGGLLGGEKKKAEKKRMAEKVKKFSAPEDWEARVLALLEQKPERGDAPLK